MPTAKKTERPRDLRKRNKRLADSRDNLKEKNKEKAVQLKRFSGTVDDLKQSRDSWRERYEEGVLLVSVREKK